MTRHLGPEEIAELAEGSLAPERAAELRTHLAGCTSCALAFVDAVRDRVAWLENRRSFAQPVQVTAKLARDSSPSPATARRRSPLQRWLPAAATATMVVALGAWALLSWRAAPTLGFALPAAVRTSIESSSARELVLPGGERQANRAAPDTRSGGGTSSPQLTAEVADLTARYEAGERSADAAARLVSALLATGDLEAASAYAREGLRGYPNDVRLLVLMAELKYRASDLAAAERLLRQASQVAPRDPIVSLDLALVLRERGDTRGARIGFERVAASGPPPLAERARRELADGRAR